jgi:oxygen-independent coproporphyrinogen-3 oxidase
MAVALDPADFAPPPAVLPRPEAVSVYLHLPFCRERCPYCDFFVKVERQPEAPAVNAFVDALEREIRLVPRRFPDLEGVRARTIYFGGGTPSFLPPGQLDRLMRALGEVFAIDPLAEITMEANPSSLFREHLAAYRDMGINRLSIGVQALEESALKVLGRGHDRRMAIDALEAAAGSGLVSYSADLMFGYPGHTPEALEAALRFLACDLAVPHISAYCLTIHEGTPYQRMHDDGRLQLPDDTVVVEMFERLRARATELGMPPYEISNFARPGHESLHNTAYWRLEPVVPLGPSACGYLNGKRVENPRSMEQWMAPVAKGSLPWRWLHPAAGRTLAGEVMMCALRRTEGATWPWLTQTCGGDPRELYAEELARALERGWIVTSDEGLRLSEQGVLWSDSLFEEFL